MATIALKPLRLPRLWLGLWLLAIGIVVGVCLIPSPDLPSMPRNVDKLEHALAFFVLSAFAVQLFVPGRPLLRAMTGLVILGMAIELAQGVFTIDRSADPLDALADILGVLLGFAILLTPWRDQLLRIERRITTGTRQ